MARTARIVVPGYPHHVTQRGVRSLPIFRSDEDRRLYLEFMGRETPRFRVGILAWRATKTGRPWIDPEHLARIEKKTGRNLQKGKPGRKPQDSMK